MHSYWSHDLSAVRGWGISLLSMYPCGYVEWKCECLVNTYGMYHFKILCLHFGRMFSGASCHFLRVRNICISSMRRLSISTSILALTLLCLSSLLPPSHTHTHTLSLLFRVKVYAELFRSLLRDHLPQLHKHLVIPLCVIFTMTKIYCC